MSLKLQKKMEEAINDELAYKIVIRHIRDANGLVAVIGVHQIIEKMRTGKYTIKDQIGYCNMELRKGHNNTVQIKISNKNGLTKDHYAYNLTTGEREVPQ